MDEIDIQAEQMRKLAQALSERLQATVDGPGVQVLLDALGEQPESVGLSPELLTNSAFLTAMLATFAADVHARQVRNMERIVEIADSLAALYRACGDVDARVSAIEVDRARNQATGG